MVDQERRPDEVHNFSASITASDDGKTTIRFTNADNPQEGSGSITFDGELRLCDFQKGVSKVIAEHLLVFFENAVSSTFEYHNGPDVEEE